jgi:hypothetical protein
MLVPFVYTQFRHCLDHLDEIDWQKVAARDWRAEDVKERSF